jgi:hypothetical protein
MGKMKELWAEGVTDLTSYNLGREAEREEIRKMLLIAADNPQSGMLPPHIVLRVMAASLLPDEEDVE